MKSLKKSFKRFVFYHRIPPIANTDIVCMMGSSSITVNVLLNDSDPDVGNKIYLTTAKFTNSTDETYASLTVNVVDSTITLTIKSGASVPAGHIFYIEYSIKDNGTPVSKCATGLLEIVTVYSATTLEDKHITFTNCYPRTPIDVLTGDTNIACTPSSVTLAIIDGSKVGAIVTVNSDKTIAYIPPDEFAGSDNIQYMVLCNGNAFTGTVYITVNEPESAFVDDIWYFGGYETDYSQYGTVKPTNTSPGIIFKKNSSGIYEPHDASGISKVSTFENSLSISSPYCDGESIFYVQHDQLYNHNNELMKNGSIQGHWSCADGLAAGYMGDNKYLLFSLTGAYENSTRGLNAYTIDMNLDNGAGSRTGTTIPIEGASASMSESIELIARAGTSNQYWIVYKYGAELRCRLVDVSDPGSLTVSSIYTNIGCSNNSSYQLKASHQKNKLAIAYTDATIVEVYDFDNTNGIFSNKRTINTGKTRNYNVEFSPSERYLYVAQHAYDGMLMQYDISSTPVMVAGGAVKYWSIVTTENHTGGGLKLGPDGKIYVALAFSQYLGVINDPDSDTPLGGVGGRYDPQGFVMSRAAGCYLEFSTGLTKPAIPSCNTNHAPIANTLTRILCSAAGNSSVTVNVLQEGCSDIDGNTIYLTDAQFMHSADASYASLTLNAGSVTLTLKSGVSVPADHVFSIQYSIKDNGIPASMCATGLLEIIYSTGASAASVSISSENDVCPNTPVTFTATPIVFGTPPTYQWFVNSSPIGGATLSTYTYPPNNGDKITCKMTTTLCGTSSDATSNLITMIVAPKRTPSITITAVPD